MNRIAEQFAAADQVQGASRRSLPKDSLLRSCLLPLGDRAYALATKRTWRQKNYLLADGKYYSPALALLWAGFPYCCSSSR